MFKKITGLCAILALASWSGLASAGVITTTFASNNQFAGNMFDLTTYSNSLTITGFDVNLENTDLSTNISLYTRAGTFSGFENNAAGWTLRGTVNVASAGTNNATFVNISDFLLNASTTYGVYITNSDYTSNSVSMRYTDGNNVYANADLQLSLGVGKGGGDFTGSTFNPRTWNGNIYYDVGPSSSVPAPATLFLFGLGLTGLGWSRRKKA